MATIALRERRKHHKMRYISENEDQMVVKSLSVPPGLEALMEGLTKEVLRIQPQDICLFASEHFAKLCKVRDATGAEYQYCKTTIHDKNKKNNIPTIRSDSGKPHPKDEIELLDANQPLSVPRLDLGRLSAPTISPEIKFNRSEASTAEIDKIQNGFFHSAANFINVAQVAGRVFVNSPKLEDDTEIDEHADVNGDEKLVLDENDKQICEERADLISEDNEINLVEEDIKDTNFENKIWVDATDKLLEKDIETTGDNLIEEVNDEAKVLIDEAEKQLDLITEDTQGNLITEITNEDKELGEAGIQAEIEADLISEDIKETELKSVIETNDKDNILDEANIEETKASSHSEESDTSEVINEVQNEVIELALEENKLEEILFNIPGEADIKLSTEDSSELTPETVTQVPELLEETPSDASENIDIENKIDENEIELSQEESKSENLDLVEEIKEEAKISLIEKLDIDDKEIENTIEAVGLISDKVNEDIEINLDDNDVIIDAEKVVEDEDVVDGIEDNISVEKLDGAVDEILKEINDKEKLEEESETSKEDNIKLGDEEIKAGAEEINKIIELEKKEADVKEIEKEEIDLEESGENLEEFIEVQKETNEIEKENNELISDVLKNDAGKMEEMVVERPLQDESLIENIAEANDKESALIENIQETDKEIEILEQAELSNESITENVLNSEATQTAIEEQITEDLNEEIQENENHGRKKRSISIDDIEELTKLQIPKISTINATPTPSEEEQKSIDHSITEETLLEVPTDKDCDEAALNKSALLIQSIWRGYNIRKFNKMLNALEDKGASEQINNNEVTGKEEIAATLIQSLWRGHMSRKQNLAQSTNDVVENEVQCVNMDDIIAATKLQAIWRGYLARKHQNLKQSPDTLLENKELHEVTIEEIMAARKLQSAWRGFATRKAIKSIVPKNEIASLQNEDKSQKISTIEEILAATKLQSAWRGFATRKTMNPYVSKIEEIENIEKLNEEIIAATKLQSTWRGFATRKALNTSESISERNAINETKIDDIAMEMNAAIRIQSIWRGFKTRKNIKNDEKQAVPNVTDESMKQILAATLIQSLWRGHSIRKDKNIAETQENIDDEKMKQIVAATVIQSLWRGHTIRKNKNLDEIGSENLPITEEILKETVKVLESEPEEYLNETEKADLGAVLTEDKEKIQEMESCVTDDVEQPEDKIDESAETKISQEIKEAINVLEEANNTVEIGTENEEEQVLDKVAETKNDENISKVDAEDSVGIAVDDVKEDLIELADTIILNKEIKESIDITGEETTIVDTKTENEETSVLDAVNETTKDETVDSVDIAVEEAKEELAKIADEEIKDVVDDTIIDENKSKTETEASMNIKIEESEEELKEIADHIITEIEISDSLSKAVNQDSKEELNEGEVIINNLESIDDSKTNDGNPIQLDETTAHDELIVDDTDKNETNNDDKKNDESEDTKENILADTTEEAEKQKLINGAEMKVLTDLENQIISHTSADEIETEEQSKETNANIKETLQANVLEKELDMKLDEVQNSESIETTINEENDCIQEQVEDVLKQTRAATKLQSVWRGYNYRKSNKVDDTEDTQVDINEDNEKVSANITENLEILESELENTDNSELTSEQQLEDVSVQNIIETPNQTLNLIIEENQKQIPIIEDYIMDQTDDNETQSSEIHNELPKIEDGINSKSTEKQDPSKIDELKTEVMSDINNIITESSIEEIINKVPSVENNEFESPIIEEKNEDELHEASPEEIISAEVQAIAETIKMENEILEETTPKIQEPTKDEISESNRLIDESQIIEKAAESSIIEDDIKNITNQDKSLKEIIIEPINDSSIIDNENTNNIESTNITEETGEAKAESMSAITEIDIQNIDDTSTNSELEIELTPNILEENESTENVTENYEFDFQNKNEKSIDDEEITGQDVNISFTDSEMTEAKDMSKTNEELEETEQLHEMPETYIHEIDITNTEFKDAKDPFEESEASTIDIKDIDDITQSTDSIDHIEEFKLLDEPIEHVSDMKQVHLPMRRRSSNLELFLHEPIENQNESSTMINEKLKDLDTPLDSLAEDKVTFFIGPDKDAIIAVSTESDEMSDSKDEAEEEMDNDSKNAELLINSDNTEESHLLIENKTENNSIALAKELTENSTEIETSYTNEDKDIDQTTILQEKPSLDEATSETIIDTTSEVPNPADTVNNADSSVIIQTDLIEDFGNADTDIQDIRSNLIISDASDISDDNIKSAEEDQIPKEENTNTIVDTEDKELDEVEALNLRLKNLSRTNITEILHDETSIPEIEEHGKTFEDSKEISDTVDTIKTQEELTKDKDVLTESDENTPSVHDDLDITIVPGIEQSEDTKTSEQENNELGKNIESFDKALMEITDPIILRSHIDKNIIDTDDKINDLDLKTQDSPNIKNETTKQAEIEESTIEEPEAIKQNEISIELETKPLQIIEVEQENTDKLTEAENSYEEINKEHSTDKDIENTLIEFKPEEQELLISSVQDSLTDSQSDNTNSVLIDEIDLVEPKLSVNIDIQENDIHESKSDNPTENTTLNSTEGATKHDTFHQENKSENDAQASDNEENKIVVALTETEKYDERIPELLKHASENIVTEIIHDNPEEINENMDDETPLKSTELQDETTTNSGEGQDEGNLSESDIKENSAVTNINEVEILKNEDKDSEKHTETEMVIEESVTLEEVTPENIKIENIEESNSKGIIDGKENVEPSSNASTENTDNLKNDQAAVKIQSAWRGHNVRRTIQDQKELTDLQKPTECDELSGQNNLINDADIISKAATTIQAGARGYLVRKRRNAPKFTETPQENSSSINTDESTDNISLASMVTVIEKPVTAKTPEIAIKTNEMEEQLVKESENIGTNETILELPTDEKATILDKEVDSIGTVSEAIVDINTIDKTLEDENVVQDVAANGQEIINITKEETVEHLDEIDALNLRLQNLSRSNVYHAESPNEENESPQLNIVETTKNEEMASHKDDLNTDDKNEHTNVLIQPEMDEEIAQVMENQVVSNEPRRSVNFDEIDIDSSKYDLKVDQHTPRSKNSSPVHELSSAALKIGAAITVHDDTITDALDGHEEVEEKSVEYIHIPLQGAIPKITQSKLEETAKETDEIDIDSSKYDIKVDHHTPRSKNSSPVHELSSAALKIGAAITGQDDTITDAIDGQEDVEEKPVEYIHIPLKGAIPQATQRKLEETAKKTDSDSPEYIYIPLKDPNAKENIEVEQNTIINDDPPKIEESTIHGLYNDKILDNDNAALNDNNKESETEIVLVTSQPNIEDLNGESDKSEVLEEKAEANENKTVENLKKEDIKETSATVIPIEASLNDVSNAKELQKSDAISLNEETTLDASKEETLKEKVPEELIENTKIEPISINEEIVPEESTETANSNLISLHESVDESKEETSQETEPEGQIENTKLDPISLNGEAATVEKKKEDTKEIIPEEATENTYSDSISLNDETTVDESKEENLKETEPEEQNENIKLDPISLNDEAATAEAKKEDTKEIIPEEATENANSNSISLNDETNVNVSKEEAFEEAVPTETTENTKLDSISLNEKTATVEVTEENIKEPAPEESIENAKSDSTTLKAEIIVDISKNETLKKAVPEEPTENTEPIFSNEETATVEAKKEDIKEIVPEESTENVNSDSISLNEETTRDESKEETLLETEPEEQIENTKLDSISLNEETAEVEETEEDTKETVPEESTENVKSDSTGLNAEITVDESKNETLRNAVSEEPTENTELEPISLNEETGAVEAKKKEIKETVPEESTESAKSLNEETTGDASKQDIIKETSLDKPSEKDESDANSETESLQHKTPEIASEKLLHEDTAEENVKKETEKIIPHEETIVTANLPTTTGKHPEENSKEDSEEENTSKERLIESAKSQSPRIKSPIADIDAFLERNKQRTITRQDNVESSGHRQLFDEIDSIIESYGQKRQMSPTSSSTGDYTELETPKIENESSVQGQQLSDEQTSVPNVIMAHTSDAAATKIQSAYRGFRTRQQLKTSKDSSSEIGVDTHDTPMERKNSLGSDKTYTVVRSPTNISTPEVDSSDDETVKNLAASKIQKSYRNYRSKQTIDEEDLKNEAATKIQESYKNYRQKRSLSLIPSHNENFPDIHQVHQFKLSDLEDKYLDYPNETSTSPTAHEELKDISEISHCAATKIQSTYRGFKTRQTLQNNNANDSDLETIPEIVSPNAGDNLTENTGGEEVLSETSLKDEYSQLRRPANEEVSSGSQKKINGIETKINNDESQPHYSANNVEYDSDADGAYRHHPHSDDATDEEIAKDSTTTTTARTTTSGIRSESSIYDEDESEPSDAKSSPDARHQLAQGYDADEDVRNEHGNGEHYHTAGLQHSGEMHDSVDIFLSSEELSQGAEVLTSRDITKTDDRDDDGADGRSTVTEAGDAHALRESAAKYASASVVSDDGDHVHSVMETAKNVHNKKNYITNNAATTPASQPPQGEMGGNDEANAATKIQAGFRGYQVRKQMKTKKNGSDDAKQVKRCSSGRRRSSGRRGETPKSGNDLEEKSATKIQAGIRGFLVRKRQQNAKGSKA